MARVNRSRYAVLGMLSLGDGSGYEVRRRLEERVAPFWQESYGQIYPLLTRLLEEGLVAVVGEDGRGRTFTLTDAGRAELVDWLRQPPVGEQGRNEVLLKAFLGTETSPETVASHVRGFREQLTQELAGYRANLAVIRARDDDRRIFSELTVSYGISYTEAMIGWCDQALARLGRTLEG